MAGNALPESASDGRRQTKERDLLRKNENPVSTWNEGVVVGASVREAHFTCIKGFD